MAGCFGGGTIDATCLRPWSHDARLCDRSQPQSSRGPSVFTLWSVRTLADAVREMAAIDRLNLVYWKEAVRHLAVRRAIWVGSSEGRPASFQDQSRPAFADFVNDLSADTESLLVLLQMALRNGSTKEFVRQALNESGIDLSAHIAFANRLIAIDKRRIGISDEQLAVARALI